MNSEFTVKYTNKNIMDKLQEQDTTLSEILAHAKVTNGRVNRLEKLGVGIWISEHPFKFALFLMAFTAVVISDIRQPLLKLIGTFMGFV